MNKASTRFIYCPNHYTIVRWRKIISSSRLFPGPRVGVCALRIKRPLILLAMMKADALAVEGEVRAMVATISYHAAHSTVQVDSVP